MSKPPDNKVVKTLQKGVAIYKTNRSPYWFARIWNPCAKKYVVRSTKETSRIEAREAALELSASLNKSKFQNINAKSPASFKAYADRLLKEVQQRTKGDPRSYVYSDAEKILFRKGDGLVAYFGCMSVDQINAGSIRSYLTALDEARSKPLAQSTKVKNLSILKQVLELALDDDVLTKLPRFPKVKAKDNPRPTFTSEEYRHLMRVGRVCAQRQDKVRGHVITHTDIHMFAFMVHSYLRPTTSELFGLRRRDISEEDNPARLEARVRGKTGYRRVVMNPHAIHYWYRIMWAADEPDIPPNYPDSVHLLFPTYDNRKTAAAKAGAIFRHVIRQAELEFDELGQRRTLYSLRHFAIQQRLRSSTGNVNIYWLAQNAGTSVDQLERFYLKFMNLTAEQISNLHSGLSKEQPI